MHLIGIVSGAVFAAAGVFFLASAFIGKRAELIQLFTGIALIAFAVWLFVDAGNATIVLLLLIGTILLLRGLLGVWDTRLAAKSGGRWWQCQLVVSLAVAVFAFVLYFRPFSVRGMCVTLGVLSLVTAVAELVSFVLRHLPRKAPQEAPSGKAEEPTPKEGKPPAEAPAEQRKGPPSKSPAPPSSEEESPPPEEGQPPSKEKGKRRLFFRREK